MDLEEKKLRKRKEKALNDGNLEQIADACSAFGDFLNQTGRYQEAIGEYEKEAISYQKLGPKYSLKMAKAHRMMAEMFMILSEFDSALSHVNIYLKQAQTLGNKIEEQRAYATLGRTYLLHGQSSSDVSEVSKQLKCAEKAFIKSLLIVKELTGQVSKIEMLDMQSRLYLNIGVVKEHLEDFEEAINYKEKALQICKANDIFELQHLCYLSLSLLYHHKKCDFTKALRYCNLALDVAQRLPEKSKKICETLITKADIFIKEGDFQSAKKVLLKAYKYKTPNLNDQQNIEKTLKIVAALCYTLNSLLKIDIQDNVKRKLLYEKMGDGCCLLQNYGKAIEYYLETLQCAENMGDSKKQLVPIYVSLYQTYKDNKEYDKSLEYLWKEYEANKDNISEAVSTLCNIAEVCELQLKPFWTIYEVYKNALNEAKKVTENNQLLKFVYARQYKLATKYNMNSVAESVKEDAGSEHIDTEDLQIDDDQNSEDLLVEEENTPDIGEEICLDELTDSNSESEESTSTRSTRRKSRVSFTIKRNNKGETQLHQACISGNMNLVRRLVDQGHAINVRDNAGWLPLHEACNHGFADIVQLLLERGAISAINDKGGTSCDGITPLYDACCNGFLDVVEILLEKGANVTLKTDFGDTPLNILDKWRSKVDLDYDEQAQYEKIRSEIVFQLNKVGAKISSSPLTNSNKYEEHDALKEEVSVRSRFDRKSSSLKINEDEARENVSLNISVSQKHETKNTYERKLNAKEEYKNAMESLKHPKRSMLREPSFSLSPKKRAALLDEDEVDDNWLDDDIIPQRKRQKSNLGERISSTDPVMNQNEENSNHYTDFYTLPTKATSTIISDSPVKDNCSKKDAFSFLFDSKNNRKTLNMNRNNKKNKSRRGSTTSSNQSSLIDNGFVRFNDENSNDDPIEIEPDSTTNMYDSPKKCIQIVERQSPLKQIISFKIKVEDELLLVPVERDRIKNLSIQWLAEETSRRYYNLIGLKPVLRLTTQDGFAFEESDSISVAIDESIILTKVKDWKISPLAERYEEMCINIGEKYDTKIKSILEKSHISNILSLRELALTSNKTGAVFKALMHQSTLRILDLSNNFIGNEGCRQIGKSLATLQQLKVLNLQGNCISSEGLGHLLQCSNTSSQLAELEVLDLSFNPLSNAGLKNLESLCKIATKLNTLIIQSCQLTNLYQYNLGFDKLINLNISFNSLTGSCIANIFSSIKSSLIEKLSVNFINSKHFDLGSALYEFANGINDNFKQLEVADFGLTDSDVYKIVRLLSKCKSIEVIDLSNNKNITCSSLKYILENLANVRKIILDDCDCSIDKEIIQKINLNRNDLKLPEFISLTVNDSDTDEPDGVNILKEFWIDCHKENAKVCCKNNIVCLYVRDSDLAVDSNLI